MTRKHVAMVAFLGSLAVFGLLMFALFHSSPDTQAAASAAPAAQPKSGGPTASSSSLMGDSSGHGMVADQGQTTMPTATKSGSMSTSVSANAKPDIYAQHARDMEKQRLAEELSEAAKTEQKRVLAYDSPLRKGNYRPSLATAGNGDTARTRTEAPATTPAANVAAPSREARAAGTAHPHAEGQDMAAVQQSAGPDVGYLRYGRIAPRSPDEIKKGSVIPAVLLTPINSNLPGNVTAQVSENVYDSKTGGTLLIPTGSRLFGTYSANVKYGQDRAVVLWSHLIFPDGSTLLLEDQMGTDASGQSGFHDIRQGNFLRILGANFLFSIVGAGQQAFEARLQSGISGSASTTSALGNLVSGAAGLAAGNAATSAAGVFNNQNASVAPTLIIRAGYRFNVLLAKDIVLKPWRGQ
ncbi:TrbI/VirB10 family protein [Solirhodobacter olei]|uniref:TrbI/VirB10 family protein n=1 Tax=Solirhodobacter olei TaxID=2493082 RepID=UPI000FDA8166|nr:TrbI/VirB10 family protein [Solirhodobacter olei]